MRLRFAVVMAGLCAALTLSAFLAAAQVDTTPPAVAIERPRAGYLYVWDREMLPTGGRTIVVGPVTAQVTATDGQSGMGRVEFWIGFGCHGEQHFVDHQAPYVWTWTGHQSVGLRKLRAYAFDNAGNEDFAELEMLKMW
ncbi:MAG: hypothetical protein PHZ19_03885 [Candidatus Thermoplasmatota archaeon]|nr:hypothetical protein [Candidatus Thermoplasmatota archaeon]